MPPKRESNLAAKDELIRKATLAANPETPQPVLETIFNDAFTTKNWLAVKIICNMPENSGNKPTAAQKKTVLKKVKQSRNTEDIYDVQKIFRDKIYQPVSGPLPKSEYTTQLEQLTRELMKPDGNQLKIRWLPYHDTYLVLPNGTQYNWSKIRQFANLQHITLNGNDFELYKQYVSRLSNTDTWKPRLNHAHVESYRSQLNKFNAANHSFDPDDEIRFEEMQAINVYTGPRYNEINAILRDDRQNNSLRHAVIASVIAASGVRKLPATVIKDTYRKTSVFNLEEQIQAAAERGVVSISGFVSTSTNQGAFPLNGPAASMKFHYTKVTGIYIAPISQYPGESEFLMLPGQFRYLAYYTQNNNHHFEVVSAIDITLDLTEAATPNIKASGWLSKTASVIQQWGLCWFATDNPEDHTQAPTHRVRPIQKPLPLTQAMQSLHRKVDELNLIKQANLSKSKNVTRYEKAHDLEEQLTALIVEYFDRRKISLDQFKIACHIVIDEAKQELITTTRPNDQWGSLLNWLQFIIKELIHTVSSGYFFKDLYKDTTNTQITDDLEVQVDSCVL